MRFSKMFLLHAAGSLFEALIGQSFTQRLIRRKAGNVVRRLKGELPLRSWQDGRTNTPKRASQPTKAECERLNHEAARSV